MSSLYRCPRCEQTIAVDLFGEMTEEEFNKKVAAHQPKCQTPEEGLEE